MIRQRPQIPATPIPLSIWAAVIAAMAVPWPFWSGVLEPPSRMLWPGTKSKSGLGAVPLSITAITIPGSPCVSDHASGTDIAASGATFGP